MAHTNFKLEVWCGLQINVDSTPLMIISVTFGIE